MCLDSILWAGDIDCDNSATDLIDDETVVGTGGLEKISIAKIKPGEEDKPCKPSRQLYRFV